MKKEILIIILGVLIVNFSSSVFAEKLEINVKSVNSEKVIFEINLYDNSNNLVDGRINYMIQNYYTDLMKEDESNSGEEIIYFFPENPVQGPWKIIAKYKDIETNELFQVGKVEKASIRLEGNSLIIKNVGNTIYDRNILISIGDHKESVRMYLEVGGEKKIRLTAPSGEYVVKVDDGTTESGLTFSGVSLTGNAVGIEKIMEGNFFQRYPLVSLFLLVLVVFFFVVLILKAYRKYAVEINMGKKKKKYIRKLAKKLR
ncbi:MAG: hypothetical protein QXW97_02105 [Candidatus Pacearchaeota archaeon]